MAYINKNVSTMAMPSGMNRMGQFPLDMSSVYYDLDSLKTYAESGAIAYVGQVVSLVDEENNKVTVYSIQDTAGTLKEVGTVPTGDEDTIVVAADGTISLAGIENLSFTEKDAEGNDVDVTYQALLTKDGLTWVKPSKTTVEGLATLIDGLTVRVKALEDADFATQIANEKKRAEEAEKALDDAIKAIDFMDADEVADAIEEGIKDLATKKYVDDELIKKVDVETYNTDKKALDDEDAAIRKIAEDVTARVEAFLDGTGTEEALDSLQELIAYINTHDDVDIAGILKDIEGLENKLAGIDTTVVAYVTAAIDALKIGDYAKAADLTALAGRVETLEGKVDVDKVSTAIATAKDEAIAAAASDATTKANDAKDAAIADAAGKYATTGALEGVSNRVATLEEIDHTLYATKEALKATDDVAQDAQSRVGIVEGKIDEITSVGGEPNVIERIKVNGVTQTVTSKEVDITVPTKTSDLTDDTFGTLITAAQNKANEAATAASNNAQSITALDGRLTDAEKVGNDNAGAIAGHATRLSTAEAAIETINTVSLPAKADKSVVEGLATTVGEHTTAISTLNTTTIPALQADINSKATSTALTEEINRATAAEQANANAIKAIADDYLKGADKTALENAIALKADTTALEAEVARATKKEGELAELIAGNTAVINSILGNEDEVDLNSIAELAAWITEHGKEATAMAEAIEKNAEDIAANTKKIGEVEASIPGALATTLADYKVKNVDGTTLQLSDAGVASVKAISTDLLVQGELELVLNGGNAS